MGRTMKACALAVLAVILLMGVAPAVRAADATTSVTEEQGTTTLLGGGDHRFIRFGQDAAFGVLWGTNATPNFVYLVALKARYLGVADVKTADGRVVENDRPLKVYTVYAIGLGAFLEFNDTNGDGIASYSRQYDAQNYTTYVQTEPLVKRVSLRQAWEASDVVRTESGATRTWTFTLTARNLTYTPMNGTANGTLDEVAFTFHLTTTTVHVDNQTVPQYAITVERIANRYRITNVTSEGTSTWSGDRFLYTVKWDQRIVGWDFDPANTHPGLVLELLAVVGNRILLDASGWFDRDAVLRLHESGEFTWRDTSGAGAASDLSYQPLRKLRDPWLRAGGDWSSIGNLTWVSNATVNGGPGSVYAQVQGGIAGLVVTRDGIYLGFAVLVGLSFPAGATIEHDPTVTSDAFERTSPAATGNLVLGLLLVLAVAVVVVIAMAARRRSRASPPMPPAP